MKPKILILVFLFISLIVSAQKSQRIAYIDMEYILENIPEYLSAQNSLDNKVSRWRGKLDKLSRHIEKLKSDLENEKAILTQEIILEKEYEITLSQEELRRLENLYFGPDGDMFQIRKFLVQPIQDQVYNSIQTISKSKKYDFVFSKSTELIMLYSNKKYDISDQVLNLIVRDRKQKELEKKKNAKKKNQNIELTEEQKKKMEDRDASLRKKEQEREAAIKKSEEDKAAKKKEIEDSRKKRLEDIEAKRELLRQKKAAAKKKREDSKKEQENN